MSLLNPLQPPAGTSATAAFRAWLVLAASGTDEPSTRVGTGCAEASDPQGKTVPMPPPSKSAMVSESPTLLVSPCGRRVSVLVAAALNQTVAGFGQREFDGPDRGQRPVVDRDHRH